MSLPIVLKWGQSSYNDGQLSIQPGSSAQAFKLQVQSLTGVPLHRQKLLCPKGWKGALQDDDNIPNTLAVPKGKRAIIVTLIGSADTLIEKPLEERPRFAEDMTREELWKATRRPEKAGDGEDDEDIVDIVALQKEAGMDRDDGKMEMYEYNRLVTGLPQHQINDVLVSRKTKGGGVQGGAENANNIDSKSSSSTTALKGEVAMTMGMELRRAYINSLDVLPNGTIVSGLDDGHVQLWQRGQLVKDVRHASAKVDQVLAFPSSSSASASSNTVPSFLTAGDGAICIWSEDANPVMQFGSYPGTSPASIAVGTIGATATNEGDEQGRANHTKYYLAACVRITREVDPNRFRLVPQNEAERRRREADLAQEQMIQNQLLIVSRFVKVWCYDATNQLRDEITPPDLEETTGSVTKLLDMNGQLVCGDSWGGIRIYDWVPSSSSGTEVSRRQCALFQFRGSSIACMEQVGGKNKEECHNHHLLAVSIQPEQQSHILPLAHSLGVTRPRGVYVIDAKEATIKAVLDAHSDTVRCIRSLPDGGILTAGGKMDATVRVWDPVATLLCDDDGGSDDVVVKEETSILKQPGYVFDLKVLPDSNGSNVYAIAGARYNVIKIVI